MGSLSASGEHGVMIVMKFGGSSLESAGAIEQAASIVKERLDRKPVLVVSAMGKTTDRLLDAVRSGRARQFVLGMATARSVAPHALQRDPRRIGPARGTDRGGG